MMLCWMSIEQHIRYSNKEEYRLESYTSTIESKREENKKADTYRDQGYFSWCIYGSDAQTHALI